MHSTSPGASLRRKLVIALGRLALALVVGCSPAVSPENDRPQAAEKWFRRAQEAFQVADIEEARDSIQKALVISPQDPEVRMLAGRIALARLDYAETLRLLKGVKSSEASGLRGRALWYKGELDAAADELEELLNDPDIKDEWAKSIAKLARRGAGRTPFTISGGLLTPVEMPHVSPTDPFFVVPLEIDGESALALIATGNAEVVLDSTTRQEPSWVSIRFGKRLEVHDVPALAQDLSGLSKSLGAPIKALLGVNLLRHINATIDYGGRQFVARSFAPPAPPNATRVDLAYIRGGGMVLASSLGAEKGAYASLLVDTAMSFPLALDKEGWKKAGIDSATLKLLPQTQEGLRGGVIPMLRIGAYDVPKVPGVFGAPIAEIEKLLTLNIDGVVGAGLLAHFRITFGDGGRLMWIEDHTAVERMLNRGAPQGPPPPAAPGPADAAEDPPPPAAPGAVPAPKDSPTKKPGSTGAAPPPKDPAPKKPAGPSGQPPTSKDPSR
jgi:tetratricopeptide (TPR) repeat protein